MIKSTAQGVNVNMLQQMYNNDEKTRQIFDYLADRQRNYSETRPEILAHRLYEKGVSISRAEALSFFRSLERAGCGRYIEGRRGHASRFEWHVRMRDVGNAAKGHQQIVEEVEEPETTLASGDEASESVENTITHEFKLRPDFGLRVVLPADFRPTEASRVSDWVKTLPFDIG